MTCKTMTNNLKAHRLPTTCVFVLLTALVAEITSAKSLYVIADKGSITHSTQPVHAYDIGKDGTLTFQTQCNIPRRMLGAVGMAMDSQAGYLFITYQLSNEIHLVEAKTMTNAGTIEVAPEGADLAGIAYDHKKKRLYCAEVRTNILHVLDWEPETLTLTPITNSPFMLKNAVAYGIALDETNDQLYVANASDTLTVYSTSHWRMTSSIALNRVATSVAVDVENEYVYAGGGSADNKHLTQYHLATGTKREVQVEPDAGVMGLGVDPDTGLIYMTTGRNNEPGGDNLLVFDSSLRQINIIPAIGNPTGLAIPDRDVGFNPLNLSKVVVEDSTEVFEADGVLTVGAGGVVTYAIHFENTNDFPVTDVSVIDTLPELLTFVMAEDNEGYGKYDAKTHQYEWSYASLEPGSSVTLALTAQVNKDVEAGTAITNTVTISSRETAPTTKIARIETTNNALNLKKTVAGPIDDPGDGIDPNELISYTITFDNNDNDFTVTDITIVDLLPKELIFIRTDEDKVAGTYDPIERTFTWSYPFLRPGEAVSLGLVARVNPYTAPGTIISNAAIINSNETPPSTAGVDTITYFKALTLCTEIVGRTDSELKRVGPKEEITYTIQFQNRDNDSAVTNVTIVDQLPQHVSFVRARADDHGVTGRYDAKTHTYTWSYASLPPENTPISLDLVVQVDKNAPPATIISNSVTIDSDQTRPTTASIDAMTYYRSLNLSTAVIGGIIGETGWVDVNEPYTYKITFENDNDIPVTNVVIVDTLPKEVQVKTADGDGEFGWYDPKTHIYTWSLPSLQSGASTSLEIVIRINQGTAPSTVLTNLVTIDSDETLPTTKSIEVFVGESPLEVQTFSILPNIIRASGPTYDIQATAIFPPGIGKDDITEVNPILYLRYPLDPGQVSAKRQMIFGTATRAKVIALFDKNDLLNAVSHTGEVPLAVVGKLKSGRSWYGRATVYITAFAGN